MGWAPSGSWITSTPPSPPPLRGIGWPGKGRGAGGKGWEGGEEGTDLGGLEDLAAGQLEGDARQCVAPARHLKVEVGVESLADECLA